MIIENICILILCYLGQILGNPLELPTKLNDTDRIVGGTPIDIKYRPFQVAVLFNGYLCGGSIIRENAVLTAAHCTDETEASSMTIRAGSNFFNAGGITRKVFKIIQHPRFNINTIQNDISILKTESFSEYFATHPIYPIQLASTNPPDDGVTLVSGFGTVSHGGAHSKNLQMVDLNIVDFAICNKKYGGLLMKNQLCAGVQEGGKDSCQGDSGGPLTYNGELVGIVSWGIGCASASYPGIYTNVPAMLPWIKRMLVTM